MLTFTDEALTTMSLYDTSCFPFAVNCRFSKTFLGVPKRCGYCQKMIVGTGFTCQHCSFKCHKRCVMVGEGNQLYLRPKPCSLSRLPPGNDSISSKLLQENDINSNEVDSADQRKDDGRSETNGNSTPTTRSRRQSRPFISQNSYSIPPSSLPSDDPCCSSSLYSTSTSPSLISQPSSPGFLSHRWRRSRRSTVLSGTAGSRRESAVLVSSASQADNRQADEKRQSAASVIIDRLFNRLFPSWNSGAKSNDQDTKTGSRNGSSASLHSNGSRRVSLAKSKPLLHNKSIPHCHRLVVRTNMAKSHHGSPIAAKSAREFNAATLEKLNAASELRRKSAHEIILTATQSSLTAQSLNEAKRTLQNGNCMIGNTHLIVSDAKPVPISPLLQKFRQRVGLQPTPAQSSGHRCLRNHESDPVKVVNRKSIRLRNLNGVNRSRLRVSNTVQDSGDDEELDVKARLASTWPLSGVHLDYDYFEQSQADDNESANYETEGGDGADEANCEDSRCRRVKISDLREWTIPCSDLVLSERVHECRHMTTYRGRWHGDVMIHTFEILGGEKHQIAQFLEQVRTLTKIRHENVALFMGASVEAPLMAVVTSIRKGCPLYDAVHLENRRLAQTAKVNIARQIAQGMGYLHAKGIVLKTLTSKSVYLECKVKISMVDDGAPLKRHDRPDRGCIRRGHLTYLSPELMQNIRVTPPTLLIDNGFTKESDVFAFGTILYEMFANDFPFSCFPPFSIVWTIGAGRLQSLDNLHCNSTMKSLIGECWSADPIYRPSFTEILRELQQTSSLHQKHSSSVPEKLNKLGMHRSPYNY